MSEEKDTNNVYEARVITLGDSGVGKTNFIFRFIDDKFSLNYFSTFGIDTKFKNVKLDNGCEIKFKIYDTAGQERFKSISQNYIKKANGILLMYSISDKASFNNIENWMTNIKENSGNKNAIVLIATKCDLNEERVVSKESGEALAKQFGINFYETSSKSNINIKEAFFDIAGQIIEKNKGKKLFNNNLELQQNKEKKGQCCSDKK
jgi:small GTP-binding protein